MLIKTYKSSAGNTIEFFARTISIELVIQGREIVIIDR